MEGETKEKVDHKSSSKKSKKKSKKVDLRKIAEEPEETTNQDIEENNQLNHNSETPTKLTVEE